MPIFIYNSVILYNTIIYKKYYIHILYNINITYIILFFSNKFSFQNQTQNLKSLKRKKKFRSCVLIRHKIEIIANEIINELQLAAPENSLSYVTVYR